MIIMIWLMTGLIYFYNFQMNLDHTAHIRFRIILTNFEQSIISPYDFSKS